MGGRWSEAYYWHLVPMLHGLHNSRVPTKPLFRVARLSIIGHFSGATEVDLQPAHHKKQHAD